ncbi:hypothetical protein PaecuDRAFT_2521 [Paenibacillus curdlanolyticus YK9]|uniref:Lipoprotein n=1 Tax=Paenibacillus curdlanolyticus YK9 TaxID=717606 RepID=E0IA32_9BACL|nr:hypothetical protein [Paenibacillus curdlanolyticus]EFM10609.1 hypothetical protein PaecuDRAFT_2521 [Paenibacillus curdlanolyticus YK9]
MLNKIVALMLILSMLVTLAACADKRDEEVTSTATADEPRTSTTKGSIHVLKQSEVLPLRLKAKEAEYTIFESGEAFTCNDKQSLAKKEEGQFDLYYMCDPYRTHELLVKEFAKAMSKAQAERIIQIHIGSALLAEINGRMAVAPYEGSDAQDWSSAEMMHFEAVEGKAEVSFRVWDYSYDTWSGFHGVYIYEDGAWKEDQLEPIEYDNAADGQDPKQMEKVSARICEVMTDSDELDDVVDRYTAAFDKHGVQNEVEVNEKIANCFGEARGTLTRGNQERSERAEQLNELMNDIVGTSSSIAFVKSGGGHMYLDESSGFTSRNPFYVYRYLTLLSSEKNKRDTVGYDKIAKKLRSQAEELTHDRSERELYDNTVSQEEYQDALDRLGKELESLIGLLKTKDEAAVYLLNQVVMLEVEHEDEVPIDVEVDPAAMEEHFNAVNATLCDSKTLASVDLTTVDARYEAAYETNGFDLSDNGRDRMSEQIGNCFNKATFEVLQNDRKLSDKVKALDGLLDDIATSGTELDSITNGGGSMFAHFGVYAIEANKFTIYRYANLELEMGNRPQVKVDETYDEKVALIRKQLEKLGTGQPKVEDEMIASKPEEYQAAFKQLNKSTEAFLSKLTDKNTASILLLDRVLEKINNIGFL